LSSGRMQRIRAQKQRATVTAIKSVFHIHLMREGVRLGGKEGARWADREGPRFRKNTRAVSRWEGSQEGKGGSVKSEFRRRGKMIQRVSGADGRRNGRRSVLSLYTDPPAVGEMGELIYAYFSGGGDSKRLQRKGNGHSRIRGGGDGMDLNAFRLNYRHNVFASKTNF